MKKLKKIIILLIGISLFKTTAYATKNEGNSNSIKIINKLDAKQEMEKETKDLLEKAKKIEENFNLDEWSKILKSLEDNLKAIMLFWPILQEEKKFESSNNCDKTLNLIEKIILKCFPPIIIKDEFSLINTPLNKIKKSSEYTSFDDSLKSEVENFLRRYYTFSLNLTKILRQLNILILKTPKFNELIECASVETKLKNLNYSEKTDYINNMLKAKMKFSEEREHIKNLLNSYMKDFTNFYVQFNKCNFNHKITENYKNFLNFFFEVLKIEMVNKKNIDSLFEFKKKSKDELSWEQENFFCNTNSYFEKVAKTQEKLITLLDTIHKLEENKEIKVIAPINDNIKNNAAIFFNSLKIPKIKNYINKNKEIIKKFAPLENYFKKIISGEEKYKGRIVNFCEEKIEEVKQYLEDIKMLKKTYELDFLKVKKDLQNIQAEQIFKKEIDEMQEFIDNCEKVKNIYDLYFEFFEKMKNESNINIEDDPLVASIEEWNIIKPILEGYQKNILTNLIPLIGKDDDEISTDIQKDLNETISELNNNLNLILTDDLKENIKTAYNNLIDGLNKLDDFHTLNIVNKKEKKCSDISIKNQFKNVKREYEIYKNSFNAVKNFFKKYFKLNF